MPFLTLSVHFWLTCQGNWNIYIHLLLTGSAVQRGKCPSKSPWILISCLNTNRPIMAKVVCMYEFFQKKNTLKNFFLYDVKNIKQNVSYARRCMYKKNYVLPWKFDSNLCISSLIELVKKKLKINFSCQNVIVGK